MIVVLCPHCIAIDLPREYKNSSYKIEIWQVLSYSGPMYILGIETSCDETSAAIIRVENDKPTVLCNIVSSQIKLHAPFGGVVPSLAAREHTTNLQPVITEALNAGQLTMRNITLVAVTAGPGLMSSLLVGTAFAKTLAWRYDLPIIGTNHMEGHIYSNWLTHNIGPDHFPSVCLVVSGGHTQLILMRDHGMYELIGQTRDDAAGEAFDKIARILGLEYPGGPAIERQATQATLPSDASLVLPRPMIHSGDFDFSFSGLKTAVLYLVRDMTKHGPLNENLVNQIAYEAREAIVETLVTKTIQAAEHFGAHSIMLSGGVSASVRLRDLLSEQANKSAFPVFIPDRRYTTDNAAMIAMAGYWNCSKNKNQSYDWSRVTADANWEIV